MSQKMANESSRNKNKMFHSLIGDDSSEVDPSYRMFLEHLREDGESYVFDVPDADHVMPASVRYEEYDDISCVVAMDKDCTNVLNSSLHRNRCGPNTKRSGVTSGRDAHMNVEMNTSIDESYAAFLSLMKIEDGFMVVEPQAGVTIVYEQEDETPAGYDEMRTLSSTKDRKRSMNALGNMVEDKLGKTGNIISERGNNGPAPENFHSEDLICTDEHGFVPYTESSAFNVCEDDQGEPLAFSYGVPSTFDEKLDYVLRQPYDRSEYEVLLRKATDRKHVSKQRHLRSASKCYATDIVGPSYLDHYPDMAKLIDYADTDEARLSLLRKFFFWLENLSHEGAHMPWHSKGLACDPILADD